MAQPPDPTPRPEKPAIADVSELFRDDVPVSPPTSASQPATGDESPSSYELEVPLEETETPETSAPAEKRAPREPPPVVDWAGAPQAPAPKGSVEQVWSRAAEWGPNLALLAIVGVGVLFLVYQTFTVNDMTLGFLILFAGIGAMILLSYPIVITLERPVRVTPEQAVTDFYGALSHHLPHFRRMWLLLSTAGRTSSSFASLEGFKAYWKLRLTQLRGDGVSKFTPLVFRIDDFQSEKSAGRTTIDVKFTVTVHVRGKQQSPPLDSIKVSTGLVKGPDQMWYLNKGTLPGERK
ncbi:MAG TPA: hypothetical protein VGZ22_09865 [Isosphaeraceae bacterium]|jgi:hypothetical protein|nr:hypothetical protein [Isosphaeraceae bacterium]